MKGVVIGKIAETVTMIQLSGHLWMLLHTRGASCPCATMTDMNERPAGPDMIVSAVSCVLLQEKCENSFFENKTGNKPQNTEFHINQSVCECVYLYTLMR